MATSDALLQKYILCDFFLRRHQPYGTISFVMRKNVNVKLAR